MCKWNPMNPFNPDGCGETKTRIEIRKDVETVAGTFDMEDTICVGCGAKSSKCIIPEPKVKRKGCKK